jgi:hypothetical protein
MEFRIFDPLEVLDEGRRAALGASDFDSVLEALARTVELGGHRGPQA